MGRSRAKKRPRGRPKRVMPELPGPTMREVWETIFGKREAARRDGTGERQEAVLGWNLRPTAPAQRILSKPFPH